MENFKDKETSWMNIEHSSPPKKKTKTKTVILFKENIKGTYMFHNKFTLNTEQLE